MPRLALALSILCLAASARAAAFNAPKAPGKATRLAVFRLDPDAGLRRYVSTERARAGRGLPESQELMGGFYENGMGVPHVDLTKAYVWYRAAANNPNADPDMRQRYKAAMARLQAKQEQGKFNPFTGIAGGGVSEGFADLAIAWKSLDDLTAWFRDAANDARIEKIVTARVTEDPAQWGYQPPRNLGE